MPCLPVQALALPELTTTTCAVPFFMRSTQIFTGAAQTWLVVNMPGDGRGRFGNDECEVAFRAFVRAFAGAKFFDVAKHAAGEKAFGRDDGAGDFFKLHFHFQLN